MHSTDKRIHALIQAAAISPKVGWIQEGPASAAEGHYWASVGKHFLHIVWHYPRITFSVKEPNERVLIECSIEPSNIDLWRDAKALIDTMPARAAEMERVFSDIMKDLGGAEPALKVAS